jgi:hypothetical protein
MTSISESEAKTALGFGMGAIVDATSETFQHWSKTLTSHKSIVSALGKAGFGLLGAGYSFALSEQETTSQKLAEVTFGSGADSADAPAIGPLTAEKQTKTMRKWTCHLGCRRDMRTCWPTRRRV